MKRLLTIFLILACSLSIAGTAAPGARATAISAPASAPRLAVFMEYLKPS